MHVRDLFLNAESLKDVEKRILGFIEFLKENSDGKIVGIVTHRAPQLTLGVIAEGLF